MSDNWHYKLGGQEFGPVTTDQLRSLLKQGEIGSRTPARSKVIKEWTPIGTLSEFGESIAVAESVLEKIPVKEDAYAPMWRRGVAFAVDMFAVVVATWLLGFILGIVVLARSVGSDSPDATNDMWLARGVLLAFPWLYFTVFEGSFFQATPGKLLMGIIVTDTSGFMPGFRRAALRGLVKYASRYVFFIGYVFAPFTKRRQALHDFIARTVVVNG